MNTINLEQEKFNLEKEKHLNDAQLRTAELELKKKELALKEKEQSKSRPRLSPANASIIVALISAFVTVAIAYTNRLEGQQQPVTRVDTPVNKAPATLRSPIKTFIQPQSAAATVFICLGSSKVYHLSEQCYHLKACKNSLMVSETKALSMDRRLCGHEHK